MKKYGNKSITLAFVGDIMTHANQIKAAYSERTGKYDFEGYFEEIKKYLIDSDISVCNFETTLGGGTPSGYPRFSTPDDISAAIKNAGFDIAATSNNHSFDSGKEGIKRTKKVLQERGINVIGTKKSKDDKAYCIYNVDGIKIGFVNYTYETSKKNGHKTLNNRVIDDETAYLFNSFCFETIEDDLCMAEQEIAKIKSEGAQIIVAYLHWGNEYERQSNVFQRFVAYKFAKMGVDIIIGSHSHVLQESDTITIELNGAKKNVPVFYGLGNYIWGVAPIKGRDTVLNTILVKMKILYNENDSITSIESSYIPLLINQKNNQFRTMDLTSDEMKYDEEEFDELFGQHKTQIIKTISDTLENRSKAFYHFDDIIKVKVGEIKQIPEYLRLSTDYQGFYCEDCLVASVLQDGRVIGNSEGYTGVRAIGINGKEENYIIHTIPSNLKKLPVLINEFNRIRDIHVPDKLVSGDKYSFSDKISLCEPAANAWKLMMLAAQNEGIYLKAVSGMRSKKVQLLRQNKYAAIYGDDRARRRYHSFGCTEHHLGVALDVNQGEYNGKATTKAQAFNWIQNNCYKFGFVPRKITSNIANTAYIHLRYYGDISLSKYMAKTKITLEEYLEDLTTHNSKISDNEVWKKRYKKDNDPRKLTLKLICDINGIEVPKQFEAVQNRIVPQILLHDSVKIENGSIFFYDKWLSGEMRRCRNALRSGAVLAFAEKQIYDELGNPMPTIIVTNPLQACVNVGKYIRGLYTAKTVCITGTAGKSTTTELCFEILKENFKTLTCTNLNNANNRINILKYIQELTPEHEIYLQEVGGSFPEHIEKSAEMLVPDIAVVTNIGYAHLDLYKEFDNLKKDKLSLLENRSKTGVAIINYDNDYLREWAKTAKGEIITFSLHNKNADYYAGNVMQTWDGLRLIVTEKKSQRSTKLKIDIVGEHNAYNVLAAFAVGRKLNLEEEKIAKCMAKFETKGIRQKMYNIGSYHIYADCFSSVEDSLVLSIQTLSKIPVGVGNKRIAVIWELMRLGNNGETVYKRIVDKIKDLDIDYIFLFGNGAKTMAADLQKYRNNVYFTSNYYEMIRWIDITKRPGDVLLFKGQHMQSTALAIDNVFGTECVVNSVNERKNNGTIFAEDIWYGVKLHGSAIVIDRQKCIEESVNIPNSIDKIPVICLNKNLFENSDIVSVNMGNSIVSILDKAFLRCNKLANIKISTNIKTIGKEAFKLCKSIKKITIPKGCIVIGEKAFEGCEKLEEICIPDTVEKIEREAFSGCDNLTIYAPIGAYAQKYAEKNNIKFIGSGNK